ncbi:lysoplasmalogenase [bacterium]|nr:lysoplasmalogenase [bacterium]
MTKGLTKGLVFAVVSSSVIMVCFAYFDMMPQAFFMKPLTMCLIITIALLTETQAGSNYKNFVLAGLVFSLVGDILLLPSIKQFTPGLLAFLVAHLFYIAAYKTDLKTRFSIWILTPLILHGGVLVYLLLPSLRSMKWLVLIYMGIVLVMSWQIGVKWLQTKNNWLLLAFVGSLLFIISDTLLAISRFIVKFELASLFIIMTYFCAQLFIALSVRVESPDYCDI